MSLILATLNIEHGRHLPKLFEFVRQKQPDVLCLQEVFAVDVDSIKAQTGYIGFFSPTTDVRQNYGYHIDPRGLWGEMILLKNTLAKNSFKEHYYTGSKTNIPLFTNPESHNHVLQVIEVEKDHKLYIIGNVHFTWSAQGEPTKLQHQHFQVLGKYLDRYPKMLLGGDFNAPRGGEIYKLFVSRFIDNLPPTVKTTIDSDFHYSKSGLKLVVDNIFSTPNYQVNNVKVICGLSDHCAVIGLVK